MFAGRIIDVHAHIFTKNFLKELGARTEYPFYKVENGRGTIYFKEGVTNQVPNSFVDIDFRLKEMDRFGITTQLISGTNPWTDAFPSPELAPKFSRMINDEMSSLVSRHKSRFLGLATLPLLDPTEAARELERAIHELGLCGAILGTNVSGTYLSDERFVPIFEVASKYSKNCILFLHPTSPLGSDRLKENGFVRSIGYTFDTTTCLLKMAYSGLFDRFPNLKILSAHLGGNIPYLHGRIDMAWRQFKDSKGSINELPMNKIKRVLYVDTISYSSPAMKLASELLGVDRLMFGTDFPFDWGIKEARESVEDLFKTEGERSKVYYENFERVLKV